MSLLYGVTIGAYTIFILGMVILQRIIMRRVRELEEGTAKFLEFPDDERRKMRLTSDLSDLQKRKRL